MRTELLPLAGLVIVAFVAFMVGVWPAVTDPQTVEEAPPPTPLTDGEQVVSRVLREIEQDRLERLLCSDSIRGEDVDVCIKALHDIPQATLEILERLACRVADLEARLDDGQMPPPPERYGARCR